PWTAWPRWSATWAELAQVTAPRAGFFLGPHWIETWIQIFGPQLQPRILVFHRDGGAAGICLIVSRRERRGPVPVRRLYLNAAGEDEADETCLEYNRLLCRPDRFPGHPRRLLGGALAQQPGADPPEPQALPAVGRDRLAGGGDGRRGTRFPGPARRAPPDL